MSLKSPITSSKDNNLPILNKNGSKESSIDLPKNIMSNNVSIINRHSTKSVRPAEQGYNMEIINDILQKIDKLEK